MIRWCVFVALVAGCRADEQPGYEALPEMARSIPAESFDPSPVLPGGMTLQTPPEGTVPYGREVFGYGGSESEARRAGRELQSPIAVSPQTLEAGQKVFETFCLVCHGVRGEGDGPVIGPKKFPQPPSQLGPKTRARADGELFHIVTRGRGQMPSYAAQVLPHERWLAIGWIRHLQRNAGSGGAR